MLMVVGMATDPENDRPGVPKERIYDAMLDRHLHEDRQMAFVAGPRQVGKTTACGRRADETLNWDNTESRVHAPALVHQRGPQSAKGTEVVPARLGHGQ